LVSNAACDFVHTSDIQFIGAICETSSDYKRGKFLQHGYYVSDTAMHFTLFMTMETRVCVGGGGNSSVQFPSGSSRVCEKFRCTLVLKILVHY